MSSKRPGIISAPRWPLLAELPHGIWRASGFSSARPPGSCEIGDGAAAASGGRRSLAVPREMLCRTRAPPAGSPGRMRCAPRTLDGGSPGAGRRDILCPLVAGWGRCGGNVSRGSRRSPGCRAQPPGLGRSRTRVARSDARNCWVGPSADAAAAHRGGGRGQRVGSACRRSGRCCGRGAGVYGHGGAAARAVSCRRRP